jgi:peptide-methionine (S)-S-oxide reductase
VKPNRTEKATFGAGRFWNVEAVFRPVHGVISTRTGYMGGTTRHPTYEDVSTDRTGHAEVVEVTFDPKIISYRELLEIFWKSHDPTLLDRQGEDIGTRFRTVIFYHSPEQLAEARRSRRAQQARFSKPIATRILPATEFWPAEEFHQHYFEKRGLTRTES